MSEGLSNTAFADLVGVTEGAVRKAEKKGRIKRFADGSIDGDASAALWKSRSDPARTKARTVPRTASTGTASGPSRDLPAEVVAELVEQAAIASTLVREVLRAEGHVIADDAPIDFDLAKTAEKIIQVHQRKQTLDEGTKRLIDASAAGRRWADEIVKLRARMLAIPGDCALELSHLTKHEISVIDRIVRDAMDRGAGDDPA